MSGKNAKREGKREKRKESLDSEGRGTFNKQMARISRCLFKTNSAEFHRLDRKIAARNAIKTALNLELEAEFEGKINIASFSRIKSGYNRMLFTRAF